MFVVFDLDGTLADGSHKNHLLLPPDDNGVWPEQDWQPWIDACADDELIDHIGDIAHSLLATGHRIEFWTGRGEHCREPTEKWMDKHGFYDVPLVMRQMDEWSRTAPDHLVKVQYLRQRGIPDLIFEDKPSVVAMWRELGIPVAQVEPPFAAAGGTVNFKEKAA